MIIYYIVISIQNNTMFVSGSVIVYCLTFVSTPFFRNGAGHLLYMFIVLSRGSCEVLSLSGMCIYVEL